MIGGNVHQLDGHVLVVGHAGDGGAGAEGKVGDLNSGLCQRANDGTLADVGCAEQGDLPRALPRDVEEVVMHPAALGAALLQLLSGVLELLLQGGLELFAALVLGHQPEHLLQRRHFLRRRVRGAIAFLGLGVHRGGVDRHGSAPWKAP